MTAFLPIILCSCLLMAFTSVQFYRGPWLLALWPATTSTPLAHFLQTCGIYDAFSQNTPTLLVVHVAKITRCIYAMEEVHRTHVPCVYSLGLSDAHAGARYGGGVHIRVPASSGMIPFHTPSACIYVSRLSHPLATSCALLAKLMYVTCAMHKDI